MLTKKNTHALRRGIDKTNDRFPVVFKALGDPGRYRIFRLLMEKHDICVTEVAQVCGMSVPAASQQLRILERVGLVRKERMGQMICYVLRDDDPMTKGILCIFR